MRPYSYFLKRNLLHLQMIPILFGVVFALFVGLNSTTLLEVAIGCVLLLLGLPFLFAWKEWVE